MQKRFLEKIQKMTKNECWIPTNFNETNNNNQMSL